MAMSLSIPLSQVVHLCRRDCHDHDSGRKELLAKFMVKNGTSVEILQYARRRWELDGGVVIKDLGGGFSLFRFSLENDFLRAWSLGALFTEGQCMLVRRWCPQLIDLPLDLNIMSYLQIWMQLRIPNDYILDGTYDHIGKVLRSIESSSVGQPIMVDARSGPNDRIIRVCVEIDINKPLVPAVQFECYGEGGFFPRRHLTCMYEVPGFCFGCGRLDDHNWEGCARPQVHGYGIRNVVRTTRTNYNRFVEHERAPPRIRYFSWHPPAAGWVKLNFDGSYKPRTGRLGGGGLLRDEKGTFIAAFSIPLDGTTVSRSMGTSSRVLMAETRALENGLKLALKLEKKNIVIEGDSKTAIEKVNELITISGNGQHDYSILWELLNQFERVAARHTFREANRSADHLANMAAQADARHREWDQGIPSSFLPSLLHDQHSRVVPRLFL